MSKVKKIAVLLAVLFVSLMVISFVFGSVVNLIFPPSEAMYGDEVVEDIGGDNMLTATISHCLKVGEENIPDDSFKTDLGKNLKWVDAKNISFVDTEGNKGSMIVWKADPKNYDDFSGGKSISYISDYVNDDDCCFVVHYPEKNAVYGVIFSSDKIYCSESTLLYDILDLNRSDFTPTYQTQSYSSPSSYSGGSDHYNTVINGRYDLSRSDPDWYYDHYEYGEDYDIDNYLESEGYD